MKTIAAGAILFLSLLGSGCDQSGRGLVLNLHRAAGYLSTATTILERQTSTGAISRETGAKIAGDLLTLNKVNADLVVAIKPFLSPDGQRLELTGDGRAKVLSILGAARGVIFSRLSDPEFLLLSPAQRQEITAIYQALDGLILVSVEIVSTAKEAKK